MLLASKGREEVDRLSGTARSVWELLTTPRTMGSLLDALAEIYSIDRRLIASDVEALMKDLEARGLVERVADGDD